MLKEHFPHIIKKLIKNPNGNSPWPHQCTKIRMEKVYFLLLVYTRVMSPVSTNFKFDKLILFSQRTRGREKEGGGRGKRRSECDSSKPDKILPF